VAPVRLGRDERGLIGKILVLWLLVLALVVVAAIDGASILLANVRTAELARDAASAGAQEFVDSGDRDEARRAATAAVAEGDEDARVHELHVTRRGRVTIVIDDQANTLLAGRLGFLDGLVNVTASATSGG
jgi:hypothetical protein